MKHLTLLLVLFGVTSCSEQQTGVADPIARREQREIVAHEVTRSFPPIHTNLETFINNYALSEHRGSRTHHDVSGLKPDGRVRWKDQVAEEGAAPYSAAFEYKGTEDGKDHYLVTVKVPSASTPQLKEIAYDGRELEIWRDSEWRIGMRPRRAGGEPDDAANGSQPIRSETLRTSSAAASRR